MDAKNDISARFIEAYEALLTRKQVSDKRDFAAKLGISASMVTEISKGRSRVGTSAIQNIVSQFNINADWLLTGRGEMLADEREYPVEGNPPQQATNQELINNLLNRITEQAAEIGRLREQIEQLKKGRGHNASDANTPEIANAG